MAEFARFSGLSDGARPAAALLRQAGGSPAEGCNCCHQQNQALRDQYESKVLAGATKSAE